MKTKLNIGSIVEIGFTTYDGEYHIDKVVVNEVKPSDISDLCIYYGISISGISISFSSRSIYRLVCHE